MTGIRVKYFCTRLAFLIPCWLSINVATFSNALATKALTYSTNTIASAQIDNSLLPSVSQIPKATRISYGSVIPGVLAPGSFRYKGRLFHLYQFYGEKGQPVRINLVGSVDERPTNSLKLEPLLVLIGPNGRIIDKERNLSDTINALIRLNLPQTGVYSILVTSAEPGVVGRYSLTLQKVKQNVHFQQLRAALLYREGVQAVAEFQGEW